MQRQHGDADQGWREQVTGNRSEPHDLEELPRDTGRRRPDSRAREFNACWIGRLGTLAMSKLNAASSNWKPRMMGNVASMTVPTGVSRSAAALWIHVRA